MDNKDNIHIEKYLDRYLFNAENSNFSDDILSRRRIVDYAVLITGGWGSGKTYFIDSYLNDKLAVYKSNDVYKRPFEIVKISLFGVATEDEINQLIFEQIYKIIGQTAFKKAVNNSVKAISVLSSCLELLPDPSKKMVTGKAVTGMFSNVASFANEILDSELEELKKHPRNVIVVFDDVERCVMSKPILLGYLNKYVEKLHVPCILLADDRIWNESEKIQKDCSTLQSMASTQEKVIGARLKIKTRPESVIKELLRINENDAGSLREKSFLILQKYQKEIVDILNYFEIYNYRALKHVFVEFEHFYSFVPQINGTEIWIKDDLAQSIVTDFVATCYCHVLGVFKYDDEKIDRAFDDDWKMALYMDDSKEKEETLEENEKSLKKFVDLLRTKYDDMTSNLSMSFISKSYGDYSKKWYDVWKNWLKEEFIDSKDLKNILEKSIWFEFAGEFHRNKMLRYPFLTREDGKTAWNAFESAISNVEITRPNDLFSFYYTLLWFAENGLLPYDSSAFNKKMFEYLDKVKDKIENERLYSDQSICEYNSTYDAEKCKPYREALTKLIENKWGRDSEMSLHSLLEMFVSDEEQKRTYAEGILASDFEDKNILLKSSDAESLIDFYRNHEVMQLKYIHPLFKRRFLKGLLLESDFVEESIKRIELEFKQEKNGKPLPPNIWCLFYLKRVLVDALEKKKKDEDLLDEAVQELENLDLQN